MCATTSLRVSLLCPVSSAGVVTLRLVCFVVGKVPWLKPLRLTQYWGEAVVCAVISHTCCKGG